MALRTGAVYTQHILLCNRRFGTPYRGVFPISTRTSLPADFSLPARIALPALQKLFVLIKRAKHCVCVHGSFRRAIWGVHGWWGLRLPEIGNAVGESRARFFRMGRAKRAAPRLVCCASHARSRAALGVENPHYINQCARIHTSEMRSHSRSEISTRCRCFRGDLAYPLFGE